MTTNILVVPDSFKGSLSSSQVAAAIKTGLSKSGSFHVKTLLLADGGEGSLDTALSVQAATCYEEKVLDPLGRPVQSVFAILKDGTAFIEMAKASGLILLARNECNPLLTSSYGTGQLIQRALRSGCSRIVLFLGGSATVDGGTGMMAALGVRFKDQCNALIPPGVNPLINFKSVCFDGLNDRVRHVPITLVTDVTNPLLGENGAAYIFGPQKGADAASVERLEKSMQIWNKVLIDETGLDHSMHAGAGAAGGLGLPLLTLGQVRIIQGFEWFSTLLDLTRWVKWADIVITGEGKIDNQTVMGKGPGEIAKLAKKFDKKVYAIGGVVSQSHPFFDRTYALVRGAVTEEVAMANASILLQELAIEIGRKLSAEQ